jgi:tetratricopeptide (TPR) repeat protein
MLGQALFATGKYDEAAGVTQAAMGQLPKDKWGVVITNARELYGKFEDYTTQLRTLEAAARNKPNDPAMRFLLGYHYAYLGYPQQSVDQLEKVISLSPGDEMAKQLRDEMKAKLPSPQLPPKTSSSTFSQPVLRAPGAADSPPVILPSPTELKSAPEAVPLPPLND